MSDMVMEYILRLIQTLRWGLMPDPIKTREPTPIMPW